MRVVKSIEEIKKNMKTLDNYLSKKVDLEYSYALDLIKRGICFIADNSSGEYRFYPSRFVGYANNSMDKHENNIFKDGKETNPVISGMLGCKPAVDADLDAKYKAYCQSLGLQPNERGAFGVERKYWKM